jgi:hypothetical protein
MAMGADSNSLFWNISLRKNMNGRSSSGSLMEHTIGKLEIVWNRMGALK